jgi:glycosyltransferase involved in cell wall biosynthesis
MAAAAVRLLRDAPLRQTLSQAAAQRIAEHYSWPRLTQDLLAMYLDLTSKS